MGENGARPRLRLVRLAIGEVVVEPAANLGPQRPAGFGHLRHRNTTERDAVVVGLGPERACEREGVDHTPGWAAATRVLRGQVSRRDKHHHREVGGSVARGTGEPPVVGRDVGRCREQVGDRPGRCDADHGQRFRQPTPVVFRQEQAATKRAELFGHRGAEHESRVAHRQGKISARDHAAIQPRLLAPGRLGRSHRFDRSGG